MATAQVLLGVTPTILSILGPSTEELAMLGVVARRPLLAIIRTWSRFTTNSFQNQDLIVTPSTISSLI